MKPSAKPTVGLLALTLELYESLVPGLRVERETWLTASVLPALSAVADVRFEGAAFRREDMERSVRQFEADGVDALQIVEKLLAEISE